MRITNIKTARCNRVRSHLDSYLNDELQAETRQEVLDHLGSCPECTRLMNEGARVKAQLKRAVLNEQAPQALRDRVRRDLRHRRSSAFSLSTPWMAAAAATVMVAVAIGVFYRSSTTSINAVLPPLSLHADVVPGDMAGEVLKVGFDDHVFCAIDHGMADKSLTAEQMSERLGPQFERLVTLVKENTPQEYSVIVGHRCHYQKREFVHLILRRQDNVVSLIVTTKRGETFTSAEAAGAGRNAAIPLYQASWHNVQVAGMETRDHLSFVISNLSKADNEQIASRLAPAVSDFLKQEEA